MENVRVTALVCRNNRILMIHRFSDGNEYYVLPGGHVEDGESVESAVVRELREETSVEGRLSGKICSLADKEGRVHHVYLCDYVSGTPKLGDDTNESANASVTNIYLPTWVKIGDVPNLSIWPEEVKTFLIEYLKVEFS